MTGNLTRLVVTMDRGLVPQMQNARLISSKNGMFEYDIDLAQIPVKDLLGQLSTLEGVRDVEIKKPHRAGYSQALQGLESAKSTGLIITPCPLTGKTVHGVSGLFRLVREQAHQLWYHV